MLVIQKGCLQSERYNRNATRDSLKRKKRKDSDKRNAARGKGKGSQPQKDNKNVNQLQKIETHIIIKIKYATHAYFGHVLYALWKVAQQRCAC